MKSSGDSIQFPLSELAIVGEPTTKLRIELFSKLYRYLKPSLDIHLDPLFLHVPVQGLDQESVGDIVKEPFDVQVNYPIVASYVLTHLLHGLMGAFQRTITVRATIENLFQPWFQIALNHLLGNAVGDGRDAQFAFLPVFFRDFDFPNETGKITARGQAVLDLVQVIRQPLVEFQEADSVNARTASVCLNLLVGRPDHRLGNRK